jgi:hypothetical protein
MDPSAHSGSLSIDPGFPELYQVATLCTYRAFPIAFPLAFPSAYPFAFPLGQND